MAPGYTEIGTMVYTVTHNLIKAHAKAYRLYQNEFADTQNGGLNLFRGIWLRNRASSSTQVELG